MKTFRTVGSGASQTLEKIENNKIPIYETKAAAEADIANLSDGQIIATKDEGNENAKPVDVVESGNMHAVTSNAVADSLSYSTQEVKTGGTWIDGKPIYRKVVDIGTLTDTTSKTVPHNIQNLNKVLETKLVANDSTNYIVCNFGGKELKVYIDAANVIITSDNNFTGYSGYVIIEYTKTTD